jgi:signal transduction histidine kinase
MENSDATGEPTAACEDDLERLRELAAALRRERDERVRLVDLTEEAQKLVHQLNNVLSVISTFAASLTDEIETDHPSRESVDEIVRAAKRAGMLTRKLGDLQRRSLPREGPKGHGRA